jgi:Tol biopolymer transport system component
MTDESALPELAPGERLGPYEIGAPLGAGGMGVVYRARDPRLDRSVAIKLVTGLDAAQPERRARFQREARSIAQLQHPNVCTLFDVGEHGGRDYLVMELLEGESLQQRLARGPLPLQQVFTVGAAIAEALAAAHRQGILHRDLKPGNVMLTKAGPKLLDFGLAKLRAETFGSSSDMATRTAGALTAEGTLVGTLAYMAPEQLEGKATDERADIWALGCVLHEMATGERAFAASTPASTIAAILDRQPRAVSEIAPLSPPGFDRVVRACLAKDPDGRWQNAGDLARELRWLGEGATAAQRPGSPRRWGAIAAGGALAVVALVIGASWVARRARPAAQLRPPARLVIPVTQPNAAPFTSVAAISPDGRRVAVSNVGADTTSSLMVLALDGENAQTLAGTVGATFAFWSPDSRSLGYFQGKTLRRIDVSGGDPRTLTTVEGFGRGGAWSPNGTIVFAGGRRGPLRRVPADGGPVSDVTALDTTRNEQVHRWPQFLPDGEHFLYWASDNQTETNSIRLGSLAGGPARVITEKTSNGIYSAGHLLFANYDAGLAAQPFDWRTGKLSGVPLTISRDPFGGLGVSLLPISASDVGDLIYLTRPTTWNSSIGWYDRTGALVGTIGQSAPWSSTRLSPDGKRVAIALTDVNIPAPFRTDLWVVDLETGGRARLTFAEDDGDSGDCAWSPDGRRIAYAHYQPDKKTLRVRPAGGGAAEVLFEDPALDNPSPDWSPDGATIVFNRFEAARANYDIRAFDLTTRRTRDLLATDADETSPRFSPDGRFLAFVSNQSTGNQVYLLRLADGEKWQVSIDGGDLPRWTRGGRELDFIGADNRLRSVAVELGAEPKIGPPILFPGARQLPVTRYFYIEPTADGERFLADAPGPESLDVKFRMIVNWPGLLPH